MPTVPRAAVSRVRVEHPDLAATGMTMTTPAPIDGLDPTPTPISWRNLHRWAILTARAERRYYTRLNRSGKLTSANLAASILPSLEGPIFVIGAARSGTTFLGDCVGHLPEVSYHHEPPATKAAGRYVYEGLWGFERSRWFYRTRLRLAAAHGARRRPALLREDAHQRAAHPLPG